MQADTEIKQLPLKEQAYMWQLVAYNIQKLTNKQKLQNEKNKRAYAKEGWHVIKSIQQKAENNQLIITKADKGNSLIIMYKDVYNRKLPMLLEYLSTKM
jgi:hypothetical protein